jgi:hypothetical protein
MLAIVIVLGVIALVLLAALAFAASRVGVDASTWPSAIFVSPAMPPRPRGIQEEDLPRFVFRDRAAAPAGAA